MHIVSVQSMKNFNFTPILKVVFFVGLCRLNLIAADCPSGSYADVLKNFARKCGSAQDQSCPATSSSPSFWGAALAPGKINDGNTGTFWHSGGESEPLYLKIDLERVVNMQYVTITPRQNGHQGRLADLSVRVGDNPNAYDNTVCGDVGSWLDGDLASRNIPCVASGRYIFLTDGPTDKVTNVAELEAWGSDCINCPSNAPYTPVDRGATDVTECQDTPWKPACGEGVSVFSYWSIRKC